MKKTKTIFYIFIFSIILFLVACNENEQVTKEYLIEGKWVAIAGYENGEVTEESNCSYVEGLDFKNKDIVHVDGANKNYEYSLDDSYDNAELFMYDGGADTLIFETVFIDENSFAIIGKSFDEGQHCYLERRADG